MDFATHLEQIDLRPDSRCYRLQNSLRVGDNFTSFLAPTYGEFPSPCNPVWASLSMGESIRPVRLGLGKPWKPHKVLSLRCAPIVLRGGHGKVAEGPSSRGTMFLYIAIIWCKDIPATVEKFLFLGNAMQASDRRFRPPLL